MTYQQGGRSGQDEGSHELLHVALQVLECWLLGHHLLSERLCGMCMAAGSFHLVWVLSNQPALVSEIRNLRVLIDER